MDLLKLLVSKDALIDHEHMDFRLKASPLDHEKALAFLPQGRAATDQVRLALTYRLRDWRAFDHEGQTCRAIATPTKGVKGLDICIHVQHRSSTTVEYSQEPIMQICGNGGSQPFVVEVSKAGYGYTDLVRSIGGADSLQEFGRTHWFEADLRRLAQGLLEDATVPLWPGITLVLTPEARQRCESIQRLLGVLDAGRVDLSLLSLDNTPANRQALARELAAGFQAQCEALETRLGYTAPNVGAVTTEYEALQQKLALAESVLGVDIECYESQASVELALCAAQDAA